MATWTFIKRVGAPPGTITLAILNASFIIDDALNPEIITTDPDTAENLNLHPYLTLASEMGAYNGPAIGRSLPQFEANDNIKADHVIIHDGALWYAIQDFYSGDTFDSGDWEIVANGEGLATTQVAARVATTAALPSNAYSGGVLTATANGALTVDSKLLVPGDPVLVKDEATGANNGLYTVTTAGDAGTKYVLTRQGGTLFTGLTVGIGSGGVNQGNAFTLTTDSPIVVGTTSLTFTPRPVGSGAATSAQNTFTRRQRVAAGPTRTNYSTGPRPGLVPSLTNWLSDSATRSQSNDIADAFGGAAKVGKIVKTAGGTADWYNNNSANWTPVVPGDTVTASFYGYQAGTNGAAHSGQITLQWYASDGTTLLVTNNGTPVGYARAGWQRITTVATAPASAAFCRPIFDPATGAASGEVFYVDGLLVEKNVTSVGLYFDGGSGTNYAWSGTTNASTSVFTGEPAYWEGRDPSNTNTIWAIDINGQGKFVGIDAQGSRGQNFGDAVNDTDAVNKRTLMALAATTNTTNSFVKKQKLALSGPRYNISNVTRPGLLPSLLNWATDGGTRAQVNVGTDPVLDAIGGTAKVVQVTKTLAGTADFYPSTTALATPVSPGDSITASFFGYQGVGNVTDLSGKVQIQWLDSGGSLLSSSNGSTVAYVRGSWQRFYCTATAPAGAAYAKVISTPATTGATIGDLFYVDAVLIEEGSVLSGYFDGTFSSSSWNRVNYEPGTRPGLLPTSGAGALLGNYVSDSANRSQSNSVADAFGGANKVGAISKTAGGNADWYTNVAALMTSVVPGEMVCASFYGYQDASNGAARSGQLVLQWLAVDGATVVGTTTAAAVPYSRGAWQRFSNAGVAPVGAAYCRPIYTPAVAALTGEIFYVDGLMVEKGLSVVGTYFNGSTGAGYTWNGVTNASTSTFVGTPYATYATYTGQDSYLVGRDLADTLTVWYIDGFGKAWFPGLDLMGQPLTNMPDPVNPLDGVNFETLAFRDAAQDRTDRISQGIFSNIRYKQGQAVVTLSVDDINIEDYTNWWPVFRKYSIPMTFAVPSSLIGTTGCQTWATLQEMRDYGGCELSSHSVLHLDPTTHGGYANYVAETLNCAATIAAGSGAGEKYYVDSFIQPGTWTGAYQFDDPTKIDYPNVNGYVMRSRYSAFCAYIQQDNVAQGVTSMPIRRRYGLARSVTEISQTLTLASVQATVNKAIATGGAVLIGGHTGPAITSYTALDTICAWLAAQRDAGNIQIMTLTAAVHAKASSGGPVNLMNDGDFHMDTPGTIGSGGAFVGWSYTAGAPAVVANGAQSGALPPGGGGSLIINSTSDSVGSYYAGGFRSLNVDFYARTKNAAASAGQQASLILSPAGGVTGPSTITINTGGSMGPQWPGLSTAWQHFRCIVGLDPGATSGYYLRPHMTGTGGVEYANIVVNQV